MNMEAETGDAVVFPADVEAEYANCMKKIRKAVKLPKNLDECESAVAEIEKELKANVGVSFLLTVFVNKLSLSFS